MLASSAMVALLAVMITIIYLGYKGKLEENLNLYGILLAVYIVLLIAAIVLGCNNL